MKPANNIFPMDSSRVLYRECPKCGFLVTQKEVDLSRIDLYCVGCSNIKQSKFSPIIIEKHYLPFNGEAS